MALVPPRGYPLERHADAEICGQRRRRNDFGSTDPLLRMAMELGSLLSAFGYRLSSMSTTPWRRAFAILGSWASVHAGEPKRR